MNGACGLAESGVGCFYLLLLVFVAVVVTGILRLDLSASWSAITLKPVSAASSMAATPDIASWKLGM